MTYTYVLMYVSQDAYDEIAKRLRDAGYDHVFHDDGPGEPAIDMHGIALKRMPEGAEDD